MTVESNYAITIDTFSDWLKNLAPFFLFPTDEKEIKTNHILYVQFFPRLKQVTGNCLEF